MKELDIIYNRLIYRRYISKRLRSIGSNFKLGYGSDIHTPQFVSIGNNFYSGPQTFISTNKNNPIIIFDNVMFGQGCKIIGGNHDYRYSKDHMYFNKQIETVVRPIIIESGVWVGASSIILSKSKICEGSIIGAMSLVNNEIPPYTVAFGNPARVYKRRFSTLKSINEILLNTKSNYTISDINSIYSDYNLESYD